MPLCYKMCLLTCHSKSLKLTNSVCIWQLLEDQCAEESETDKQYDTQCSPHVLHTEGMLCWSYLYMDADSNWCLLVLCQPSSWCAAGSLVSYESV